MTKPQRHAGGVAEYFNALQAVFELEAKVLTAVLPHAGERGRNHEERCRAFLAKVLPRMYSVGTGFILCSDRAKPISRQLDVVIHDEIQNAPLHRELAALVFPVEMVYGVMEVKGWLKPSDLVPILESIAEVRELGQHSYYEEATNVPAGPSAMSLAAALEIPVKRPPRSFVFAYEADWKSPEAFRDSWEAALTKVGAGHVHGVVVLTKDWYLFQVPYQTPRQVKIFTDHALLRFMNGLLAVLRGTTMGAAAMRRYLAIETPPLERKERPA